MFNRKRFLEYCLSFPIIAAAFPPKGFGLEKLLKTKPDSQDHQPKHYWVKTRLLPSIEFPSKTIENGTVLPPEKSRALIAQRDDGTVWYVTINWNIKNRDHELAVMRNAYSTLDGFLFTTLTPEEVAKRSGTFDDEPKWSRGSL